MSEFKPVMDKLKAMFEKYAGKEGSKDTLSKKELRAVLSKEILGESVSKEEAKLYVEVLDSDGDGAVNFKEFMMFVAGYMAVLHDD